MIPLLSCKRKTSTDKLSDFMNEMKPTTYTLNIILKIDRTDKKNYLIHYRLFKF